LIEALVKALINSYPKNAKSSPSSWAVFSADGKKYEKKFAVICHADMQYHERGVYDHLITGVPFAQDLDLEYIQFLINGPFRQFKDRIHLESEDDKFYLHCDKLDTWPSNALFNFCIATRTPIEYPDMIITWGKMVAAGVDQSLAMLLASRMTYKGEGYYEYKAIKLEDTSPWSWKLRTIHCPTGHFWFDPVSSWKTLLNGEPEVKAFTANYKDAPKACRPTNVIWGKSDRDEAHLLVGKTVKEISDHFGLTPGEGKSTIEQMVENFVHLDDDDDDDLLEEANDDDDLLEDDDF
jgi:hypothetical protein